MKIREHPKIKWQEWRQPPVKAGSGVRYPPSDVGECVLNGVQCHRKDRNNPDRLSLDLEDKEKKIKFLVVYLFDDFDFAVRLCKKLQDDCIDMSIREIGEVGIDF